MRAVAEADPDLAPAVLIMARAPRRGEVRRALEPEIGASACLALHAALLLIAADWGRAIDARGIYVAHEPADAAEELRKLLGNGVSLFTGRVADAVARVHARSPGSVLVVWPDLPQFRRAHAESALADLRAGADVVVGPVYDGGFYLIGVQRPVPALFTLPETAWRGSDATSLLLSAASKGGLEVGLLRAERALLRPADVKAALADPLLPEGVARALGGHRHASSAASSALDGRRL
jgi:uncharacterized protein